MQALFLESQLRHCSVEKSCLQVSCTKSKYSRNWKGQTKDDQKGILVWELQDNTSLVWRHHKYSAFDPVLIFMRTKTIRLVFQQDPPTKCSVDENCCQECISTRSPILTQLRIRGKHFSQELSEGHPGQRRAENTLNQGHCQPSPSQSLHR